MFSRRMAKNAQTRPSWTANLGTMIDEGITVRASCSRCNQWKDVDLVKLAEIKGRDYDLWNRRSVCRFTKGCAGPVKFRHSGRGPMQAMWD